MTENGELHGVRPSSIPICMRQYTEGVVLDPVISSSPVYDTKEYTDVPYLDSTSVFNEENEELTIFAVNRDMEEPMVLECDLRNFPGYRVVQHITLEHDDVKAVNTKDNPFNVIPGNRQDTRVEDGQLITTLNKLSWNVIRLAKA